jgi:hypothetical protein
VLCSVPDLDAEASVGSTLLSIVCSEIVDGKAELWIIDEVGKKLGGS